MKKISLTVLLFLFACISLSAQHKFSISGKINGIDKAIIYLKPIMHNCKYYGNETSIDSAIINKGEFCFSNIKIAGEPKPYKLLVNVENKRSITDIVLISTSSKYIIIDTIDEHISPTIKGSIYNEDLNDYHNEFLQLINESKNNEKVEDSIYNLYGNKLPTTLSEKLQSVTENISTKSDSIFNHYALKHRNSYVTLWKLIERNYYKGYSPYQTDIFKKLSFEIKKSATGLAFYKDLVKMKALSINQRFPTFIVNNTLGKKIDLRANRFNAKFTLVDFWFSHCKPCIKDFPAYKLLIEKYTNLNFNILGISIDRKSDFDLWLNTIQKYNLNWTQFNDEDGKLASHFNINSFPTNFLLNNKGVIIAKNISLNKLDEFLNKNIDYIN